MKKFRCAGAVGGASTTVCDVEADPNPNLTVRLFRQIEGESVGIRTSRRQPAGG